MNSAKILNGDILTSEEVFKPHGKSTLTNGKAAVKLFLDPNWGKVLKAMRKKQGKGWSLRSVGSKIGYSHNAVRDWENGVTPIPQDVLFALLDLYGYSFLEFIAWLDRAAKNSL